MKKLFVLFSLVFGLYAGSALAMDCNEMEEIFKDVLHQCGAYKGKGYGDISLQNFSDSEIQEGINWVERQRNPEYVPETNLNKETHLDAMEIQLTHELWQREQAAKNKQEQLIIDEDNLPQE